MTKDQFIFEKLAREGECWHEWTEYYNEKGLELGSICTKCDAIDDKYNYFNPDFTTWEGFGWMWERAKEKYPEFFDRNGALVPDDWVPDIFREFIADRLVNPIRLRDELAKYFGWEGE
jgi:L-rhamnose isomerase